MLFITIIVFFAILGLLVLAHELGHFVVARKSGVRVEEFGFGLPPRIFGFYKDETGKWRPVGLKTKAAPNTIYSLNWIPLGGFVKIKGEQGEAATDLDSFCHKSVLRRIWIISAGVLMNIVLAAILLSIGLTIGSPQFINEKDLPALAQVRETKIMILEVLADSPAKQAGLMIGDKIISIDGQSFSNISQFQQYIDQKVGVATTVVFERQGKILTKEIIPQILSETQRGGLGIALAQTAIVSYPWYVAWWYGIIEALKMVWGVILAFYLVIKNLIISKQFIAEVYGPVGIATLVGGAVQLGFLYVLQFTATLSVIIAVINFLPFPALDGGRVLFLAIEGVRGKAINPKFENLMHNIGFALLMLLVLIVTFRDITRISSGFLNWWQKISGFF